MKKRLLMLGLLIVTGTFSAQIAAQDVQPTLDAGVQQLFTATAQAQAYGTMALTIEAQFQAALTATAQAESTGLVPTQTDITRLTAEPGQLQTQLIQIASPLRAIPAATFQMGTTPPEVAVAVEQCTVVEGGACELAMGEDSVPEHPVTLSAFQIEATEVTYAQFIAFLNALGPDRHRDACNFLPCAVTLDENELSNIRFDGSAYSIFDGLAGYPVTFVTWNGADAYCRSLGRRLPTEAEWEFAARGEIGGIYPWGSVWNPDLARTSIPATDEVGPRPVASYLSAGFGLYDMAGNVAEWVADWYNPTYYIDLYNQRQTVANPTGPTAGEQRVVRGGSWDSKPFFARSVHRQSADPSSTLAWIGFRCVQDVTLRPTATISASLTPTVTQTSNQPLATPTPRATAQPTRTSRPVQATPTFTPTATG
ncbi:MAG: formylglycine-generating enzyme family protein [Anaerolineae bacterium]|nr:formylglycine-generating enzyme family protein [Anaerolineae bacterium]